ncbi:hypothetical protein [Georgenia thermotolerans]|uniref:Uncharacterized protein n=1 Tax=Georgenia thermotolerans TaxID=527326 RepID=A0A7J5ULM6_9MICO|nr:hypothetical protein [Georgenia thermotolerans]KAE8763054.1 hypothetical protein GB883_16165 [Georgenia thermotolerans]
MAEQGSGRLSGGEKALVAVTAVLVLVFAVMLGVRLSGSSGSPSAEARTTTPPTAAAPTTAPPAGEDLSDVTWDFAAPSGNIACAIDDERALCGIADFTYTDEIPAAEKSACDGTVGHFLEVTAEGASLVCDTSGEALTIDASGVPTLSYGQKRTDSGFTCASSESGMTCTHEESGYSFSVRRATYALS